MLQKVGVNKQPREERRLRVLALARVEACLRDKFYDGEHVAVKFAHEIIQCSRSLLGDGLLAEDDGNFDNIAFSHQGRL